MKVKLLVGRVGPDGVQEAGDVIDVEHSQAQRMIAKKQALPVRGRPKKEMAVRSEEVEKAVK